MGTKILVGDCLESLKELPDESVHCVITSPPYWGMRAYHLSRWEGGEPGCEHQAKLFKSRKLGDDKQSTSLGSREKTQGPCLKCGAVNVGISGGIGLEPTFEEHLENLVTVFREVRRVLRQDGTLWLNYGDAYASGNRTTYRSGVSDNKGHQIQDDMPRPPTPTGLKAKDLMMMPERVAMALQEDGWWLRQKIPWIKRNPMPESAEDRPGSSLEFVYLLSKSGDSLFWTHPEMRGVRAKPDPDYFYVNKEAGLETDQAPDGWKEDEDWKRRNRWKSHDYFYDGVAVRVRSAPDTQARYERGRILEHKWADGGPGDQTIAKSFKHMEKTANSRSFRNTDLMFESIREPWGLITDAEGHPLAIDVPANGFKGAHFATFPVKLIEPFIKTGTSEKGCCSECGAPWARVVERSTDGPSRTRNRREVGRESTKGEFPQNSRLETIGWSPTCEHDSDPIPATVLDPFAGAGTVGLVAQRLGRSSVLIEISKEYALMAGDRITQEMPLFSQVAMDHQPR